ncbi:MAG: biotin-dependent carboxyltransferase family protein [bacterium]|jgi:antagonist of KipI
MRPVFEVLAPGIFTTVQDRGRYGYRAYGIPVAGAMDQYAFRVANLLVGNSQDAAALEITLPGLQLKVLAQTVVAITGANLGGVLNGKELPCWQAVSVKAGDEIRFTKLHSGCRSYLAVAGGIDVPLVLGSRSTYVRGRLGGLNGRRIQAGDCLFAPEPTQKNWARVDRQVPLAYIPSYERSITLRVLMGPQADYFASAGQETFLTGEYVVSQDTDRMGARLIGTKIEHADKADIVSDGVPHGAIQVPGNGQPIIMLADSQTVGGYPKIATVVSADWYKLGQVIPGDKISFTTISYQAAIELLQAQEQQLTDLSYYLDKAQVRIFQVNLQGKGYTVMVEEL